MAKLPHIPRFSSHFAPQSTSSPSPLGVVPREPSQTSGSRGLGVELWRKRGISEKGMRPWSETPLPKPIQSAKKYACLSFLFQKGSVVYFTQQLGKPRWLMPGPVWADPFSES